jgi:predicted small secreted protein
MDQTRNEFATSNSLAAEAMPVTGSSIVTRPKEHKEFRKGRLVFRVPSEAPADVLQCFNFTCAQTQVA